MNIDWSKAPEGHNYHLDWYHDGGQFYRDGGDRFIRNGGSYALKSEIPSDVVITKRVWDGCGAPPVGIDIEWRGNHGGYWIPARVIAVNAEQVVVLNAENQSYRPRLFEVKTINLTAFRPLMTPEQIATAKIDLEASKLFLIISPCGDWDRLDEGMKASYRAAITAGYRKFEIVDS